MEVLLRDAPVLKTGVRRSYNPTWDDETVHVWLQADEAREFTFRVWDRHRIKDNKIMGEGRLVITDPGYASPASDAAGTTNVALSSLSLHLACDVWLTLAPAAGPLLTPTKGLVKPADPGRLLVRLNTLDDASAPAVMEAAEEACESGTMDEVNDCSDCSESEDNDESTSAHVIPAAASAAAASSTAGVASAAQVDAEADLPTDTWSVLYTPRPPHVPLKQHLIEQYWPWAPPADSLVSLGGQKRSHLRKTCVKSVLMATLASIVMRLVHWQLFLLLLLALNFGLCYMVIHRAPLARSMARNSWERKKGHIKRWFSAKLKRSARGPAQQ